MIVHVYVWDQSRKRRIVMLPWCVFWHDELLEHSEKVGPGRGGATILKKIYIYIHIYINIYKYILGIMYVRGPAMYCLFGEYMLPTTFRQKPKIPLNTGWISSPCSPKRPTHQK